MDTGVLVCWPPTGLGVGIIISITLIIPTGILAAGDEVVGGENLVSHGKNTTGQNECYGDQDSNIQTGWGPVYQYGCLHSGSTEHSGGSTTWYNYNLATAGTISNENTTQENPAINTNTATESVCPKGWTLPTIKQIDSNRETSGFSPVLGGYYGNGNIINENTRSYWWGSEAYNGARRYYLAYNGSDLYTSYDYRRDGFYIRCVSEEKAITSLTYMQDMTPAIVAPPTPMLIAIL